MAKAQSVLIALMLLAVESSGVVALRTMKLVSGDGDAIVEAQLMFCEKIDAAFEAAASLMAGATADEIVHRYRQHARIAPSQWQ
jgi:hypothetical protein